MSRLHKVFLLILGLITGRLYHRNLRTVDAAWPQNEVNVHNLPSIAAGIATAEPAPDSDVVHEIAAEAGSAVGDDRSVFAQSRP